MGKNKCPEIKFGTDGWRAIIADTFTFKNVDIVAQGIAEWVKKDLKKITSVDRRVAVGYDNRFLGKEFAESVACVLAKNGIEVLLSNSSLPTPALSFAVTRRNCLAGVMVTASHNPYAFNGIKIKTIDGGAAGKEITDIVEKYLDPDKVKKADFAKAKDARHIVLADFKEQYVKFIRNYLDLEKIGSSKFRVVQDVMYGSGGDLIKDILKGTKIDVETIRSEWNPSFGGARPEPLPDYLQELLQKMKKEKWDLGLVLDGDADRVAAALPGGQYLNPQKILGLLALHLYKNKGIQGGVVKTICGTTMIDNICQKLGLKLHETPVGFKYISHLMLNDEIICGGEEAGGMGLPNFIPERDGTLAGLLLLEMMVYENKNIKQLVDDMEKEYGRYYYEKTSIPVSGKVNVMKVKSTKTILDKRVVDVKDYDGIKLICEDGSWVMFRPSGTEPIVRAYSEAKTAKKAKDLIQYGKKVLQTL